MTILAVIALVPIVMVTAVIWPANRVEPYAGPFPFLLFWIALWQFLTPFFLGAVYLLEKRWKRVDREAAQTESQNAGYRRVT